LNFDTPTFVTSAALNGTNLTLTAGVASVIPYNLAIPGNALGDACFNTSTGTFTVARPGRYKIDFGVSFTVTATVLVPILAGTGVNVFVRLNTAFPLTNVSFAFPALSVAAVTCVENVNGSYVGSFNFGDVINIVALSGIVLPPTVVNGSAVTNVAPFNTIVTIRSLF